MTVKERTTVFNLCVGIFNIVLGLLIEFILLAGCVYFLKSLPEATANSFPMQIVLPFILLIGLVAAMSISVKCVAWAILKFNLETKIDQKVVGKYLK